MKLHTRLFLLFPLLLLTACNVTKHLPPGETLYAGAKVKVNSDSKKKNKALSTELAALVRPKANAAILGFRYKLWFYYVAGEPRGKGLRAYIRKNLGEPPVLTSQVNIEKNRAVLENHLQNKGYFDAAVKGDTSAKGRLTTIRYDATPGGQYTIRKVHLPGDSSDISTQIRAIAKRTLLKEGSPYDLETIKNERLRIDDRLKNRGYYYFTADYILSRVDSTVGNRQVDIYQTLKSKTPVADAVPYHINNIWVYPTYTIQQDSLLGLAAAEPYGGFYVIDPDHRFKPKTFSRMLVFKKGDLYSRRAHNTSLNRLVNLGAFKFVKARFEEVDTAGYYLDPYYFLTPLPKNSLSAQITGLTKSNNATGTDFTISNTNRNTFRGAEQLITSVFLGAESQVYGGQTTAILRYGAEASLVFPRILAPFRLNTNSDFPSRTRINLRYEFYDRSNQYTLGTATGSYGFVYKSKIQNEHQLNIINLSYVQPQRIAPEFQTALDTDITLRRSIEPQFILGPSYNFNYNTNARPNNRVHNFYFNANLEAPGNILGVLSGTEFNSEKQGNGKFLNTVFSQYVRAEIEGRHYLRIGDVDHKTNMLASRLLVGVGYPYGNSDELPFIKAFFIGGVNDLRAFRARQLGPGSYYVRNYKTSGIIPDQPGDIKLLASTELRAKLISVINGAAFLDAGNIWTLRDDSTRPGSKFTSNFLNQVAVGAGVGLRIDLSFLVVRVDLATPIVRPYPSLSDATTGFNIGSSDWRRENLVLNLALGYPF